MDTGRSGTHARIHAVVGRIPRGRVATYGQVARLAGLPRHARLVGYALHALPEGSGVPWHRVIGATGRVSPRAAPGWDAVQRRLLEREGIVFDAAGRIDLTRFLWRPRKRPKGARSEAEGRAKSNRKRPKGARSEAEGRAKSNRKRPQG